MNFLSAAYNFFIYREPQTNNCTIKDNKIPSQIVNTFYGYILTTKDFRKITFFKSIERIIRASLLVMSWEARIKKQTQQNAENDRPSTNHLAPDLPTISKTVRDIPSGISSRRVLIDLLRLA